MTDPKTHTPKKLYAIKDTNTEEVVAGLDRVGAENANLARLAPSVPLDTLRVGERTVGSRGSETYFIERVQ